MRRVLVPHAPAENGHLPEASIDLAVGIGERTLRGELGLDTSVITTSPSPRAVETAQAFQRFQDEENLISDPRLEGFCSDNRIARILLGAGLKMRYVPKRNRTQADDIIETPPETEVSTVHREVVGGVLRRLYREKPQAIREVITPPNERDHAFGDIYVPSLSVVVLDL